MHFSTSHTCLFEDSDSITIRKPFLLAYCINGDSVDNTAEENSSIFFLIQMHW